MSGFTHFIGWDVGAWHCDTNSKSRDAIVLKRVERINAVSNNQ